MKQGINLLRASDEELHAELDRRQKVLTDAMLRKGIVKCYHCNKRTHLKKWFHIERYWFEDNVYTSHYNRDEDPMIVCPKCNTTNMAYKKWKYESLKPNERDKVKLALYEKMGIFEACGGKYTKYYQCYTDSGKIEYYEVPDLYTSQICYGGKHIKVNVDFK